jgi:hypothetical protein
MQRNRRLRVFGLIFLAALGLMAFGAVALRAALPAESTPGEFHFEPTFVGATLLGTQEETSSLLVPGRNLDIKCTTSHAEGSFITLKEVLATIKFTGCRAFLHSKPTEEVSGCFILNGAEKEVIVATAIFLSILHGEELFVLAEPDSPATLFTVVAFESGKGCALPLKNNVSGSITAQTPSTAAVKPLITLNEAIQKLTGDKLFFGSFESFIDASATVELTGPYKGLFAFSAT